MKFWQQLLTFIGLRAQARQQGLSASDANKIAATQVAVQEIAKQAEKEEQKTK